MEPILDLPPQQFRAALAELGLDPEREADLVRQYRRANSVFAPIYGLLERAAQEDQGQGMRRASVLPVSRPEGMSVAEAVRSGQAQLAVPQGLLDTISGTFQGIDAPYAAYQGAIPPEDMIGEALGVTGVAMGAGGMAAAPRGALAANALRNVDEYAGSHRAPSREYGASFDDPREMFGGDDIYTSRAANYFGHGDRQMDMESIRAISAARGNPDAEITVYRAVPRDLEGAEVNAGDWVSPSRRYAELHGEGPLGGDYQIIEQRVRAGDLFTDGDIHEWGYSPELAANRSTTTGLLVSAASETPAQQVARLLREGRADEVTDDLMAQADPQEMFRLYEAGETGADMPMDEASRMARAGEMGFDTGTPLYHGTNEDVFAFDLSRAGQVGADFGPASYATTSPLTASGYAGQATRNPQWRALSNEHEAALSNWGQTVVRHGPDSPEALQAQSRAEGILQEMNAIQAEVEGFRAPSDGGNVVPLLANQSGFPRYSGDGGSWYEINEPAISDARTSGAPGLRIENVIDAATTPTREAADTLISFDPTRLRSRFARFDPRLSHLANLNAANIDPLTGAVAMGASQQQNTDPLANLRAYIAQHGGVLGR